MADLDGNVLDKDKNSKGELEILRAENAKLEERLEKIEAILGIE